MCVCLWKESEFGFFAAKVWERQEKGGIEREERKGLDSSFKKARVWSHPKVVIVRTMEKRRKREEEEKKEGWACCCFQTNFVRFSLLSSFLYLLLLLSRQLVQALKCDDSVEGNKVKHRRRRETQPRLSQFCKKATFFWRRRPSVTIQCSTSSVSQIIKISMNNHFSNEAHTRTLCPTFF